MIDDKIKEILNKPSSDKDVLERWKRLGLTQGLKDEIELKVAWAYENMAQALCLDKSSYNNLLIVTQPPVHYEWFVNVIFPIIRRTMCEYYEKHNEIKSIETDDYFEFFKSHTLSDIINNDYWNYDDTYEEINDTKENIIETKHIFSKIFEVIDKNTKLVDFNFREIDMNDINERLEKENPENANHPEDKYNERRYSCIAIDAEAVFVAMITEIIIKEVFEK